MTADDTTNRLEQIKRTTLSELASFRRRKLSMSATQQLWNKLGRVAETLLLCANQIEHPTTREVSILEQCCHMLELARAHIDRMVKRPFTFWELIHQVDGQLLVVMPAHLLATKGLEVVEQFDRKVKDPIQRRIWLGTNAAPGPLLEALQVFKQMLSPRAGHGTPSTVEAPRLERCRSVLQGALRLLNEQVDMTFWQLSINVSIQILSAMVLLGAFVASLILSLVLEERLWPLGYLDFPPAQMIPFLLFGIGGAVLSNMLSKERFVIATGATARYYVYYLVVKPLIGAFAALFIILLERSQILFSVTVSASDTQSGVQFVVPTPEAAFFARAVLSVVAGFSAERLLSSIMDELIKKLLKQSEKANPRDPTPEEAAPPASSPAGR
ncbi:hypothetical protein [Hyalangium gracile]|uniref:hypothetical protein n=1 Tax=Hyalangium gracile TaxID=394092 RepID=UPI001CCC5BF1|nr:hypothetical protein [Hyalangium gracile]